MNPKIIVTISRQYGSGGKETGQKLAKQLSVPFYDNEIITLAAKKSGISPDCFKAAESLATGNFMFSISSLAPSHALFDGTLNEKIFQAQSEIIRELAGKSGGVFVGRCADFILKDYENSFHIFIHAPFKDRIHRAVSQYGIEEAYAEDKVKKTDKSRSSYYYYYTNQKWGQAVNFHLVLNSSFLGIEKCAPFIESFIQFKMKL